MPTSSNVNLFSSGEADRLIGKDLLKVLELSDFSVFNLETPLINNGIPINKCGSNFKNPISCVTMLKKLDIGLIALANNHINDYGEKGIISTIQALTKSGIPYVGVGRNINEANKSYTTKVVDKTVGIYACAEHEFSIATNSCYGANPFDPLYSLDHIQSLKRKCDYVIVLYHGGKEYYRYPSPRLQVICRRMIEKGADLVVCQHSHCIGCEEKYLNGTIVYGQGNFIMDDSDNEYYRTSLLIKVTDEGSVEYIPIKKNGATVRMASLHEAQMIMKGFHKRSKEITKKGFIEAKYNEFALSRIDDYLSALSGKESMAFRALNRISKGKMRKLRNRLKRNTSNLLATQNYIECEAHRELLIRGIKHGIRK